MPIQIPVYQSSQRLAGIPGVRQQAVDVSSGLEQFGTGLAKLGGEVSSAVADFAVKEIAERDSVAMMEAHGKAVAARQKRAKELEAHKGKDAEGYRDVALVTYAKDLEEIEKGFASDRQRKAWAEMRQRQALAWDDEVSAHVGRERERHAAESYEALQTLEDQNAARYAKAGAAEDLDASAKVKRQAAEARGAHLGWDKDEVAAEKLARLTPFHAAVVDVLTDSGDLQAAQDYLGEFRRKGEFDTKVAAQLEDKIRTKHRKNRAMQVASTIAAGVNVDAGPWEFKLDQAVMAARNNKELQSDAEMMDAVIGDLRERHAINEAAKDANDGERLGRLREKMHNPRDRNRLTPRWLDDDFRELTAEGRGRYLKELEAEREQATSKGKEKAERNWWQFMSIPLEDRLAVDVDKAFASSPKVERDKMRAYQTNTGKPGVGGREFAAEVNRKIVERGISTKVPKGGKSDAQKYQAYLENEYWQWKRQAKNEKDEPTEEDIAGMFARAHEARKVKSGLFGWSERETEAYLIDAKSKLADEGAAPSSAPAPAAPADKRPRRRDPATGELRYWNGTTWAKE